MRKFYIRLPMLYGDINRLAIETWGGENFHLEIYRMIGEEWRRLHGVGCKESSVNRRLHLPQNSIELREQPSALGKRVISGHLDLEHILAKLFLQACALSIVRQCCYL